MSTKISEKCSFRGSMDREEEDISIPLIEVLFLPPHKKKFF